MHIPDRDVIESSKIETKISRLTGRSYLKNIRFYQNLRDFLVNKTLLSLKKYLRSLMMTQKIAKRLKQLSKTRVVSKIRVVVLANIVGPA